MSDIEALRRLAEETQRKYNEWMERCGGRIVETDEGIDTKWLDSVVLAIFGAKFVNVVPALAQAILDLTEEPSEDSKRLEKLEALHNAVLRWSVHSNPSIIRQKEEVILNKLAALSPNLKTYD